MDIKICNFWSSRLKIKLLRLYRNFIAAMMIICFLAAFPAGASGLFSPGDISVNKQPSQSGGLSSYFQVSDEGSVQSGKSGISILCEGYQYDGAVSGQDYNAVCEYVYERINEAGKYFDGGASDIEACEVHLYRIPQEGILSDPSYLEREWGVAIIFSFSGQDDMISRTTWWYEKDATRAVKEIFDGAMGKNIGYCAIIFSDSSGSVPASFLLNAGQAEILKESWGNDGDYIKYCDWSAVEISRDSRIILYEDPESDVIPINSAERRDRIISDTYYIGYIEESVPEILTAVARIRSAGNNKDYDSLESSSSDLLSLVLNSEREIAMMGVSEELEWNKEILGESLDYISDAASYFWMGSLKYDREMIMSGNSCASKGLLLLNKVLSGINSGAEEVPFETVLVNEESFNYYSLSTPYHYMDSSGSNDISLKVEGYRLHNSIRVKDGESEYTLYPEFGNRFISVVIDFTHLGYRGGGPQTIITPSNGNFRLIYKGEKYLDETPEGYIENIGTPYSEKLLERKEHFESLLIFEVPGNTFDPEYGFLCVDLGKYGDQVWKLK